MSPCVSRASSPRPRALVLVAVAARWSGNIESLGPLDLAAARDGLDHRRRPRRPAAAPLHPAGRPLAAAGDDARRRPALSRDAARLRGRPLLSSIAASTARALAARRRCNRMRRGHVVSGGSTLTMQVARLIEPRDERNSCRQAPPDRARAGRSSGRSASRASSTAISRWRRSAAISRACAPPRSPISARSRCKLTVGEAALLVALPQSPESRRPDRFPDAARAARDRVLDRVAARGIISARGGSGGEARADPRRAQAASRRSPRTRPRRRSPPTRQAHALRLSIDARLQAKLETLAKESARRGSARNCRRRSSSSTIRPARSAPRIGAADYFDDARATARSTCRARRARRARR